MLNSARNAPSISLPLVWIAQDDVEMFAYNTVFINKISNRFSKYYSPVVQWPPNIALVPVSDFVTKSTALQLQI